MVMIACAGVALTHAGWASGPGEQPPAVLLPGDTPTADAQLVRRDTPYVVRQGDVLELTFALCPEFNQQVTIEPDGAVGLKDVGEVQLEGKSLADVTEAVTKAYASIMKSPEVAVSLKDFERPYFIAAGEVAHPGKYDLRSSFTIVEAVAIAGGFNDNAKHTQVVLFRHVGGDGFETRVIDVKALLAAKDLNLDVHLMPGDVVYVPKTKFAHVKPFLPNSSLFLDPLTF